MNMYSCVLDEADQILLARWAFKTAAVVVYADTAQATTLFPEPHRRRFYEDDRPPQQVQIWIGGTSDPPIMHKGEQGLDYEHLVDYQFDEGRARWTLDGKITHFNYYRVVFRLVNVVFNVVGYVSSDPKMDTDIRTTLTARLRLALLLLWPATNPVIWWPPMLSVDVFGGVRGLVSFPVTDTNTVWTPE